MQTQKIINELIRGLSDSDLSQLEKDFLKLQKTKREVAVKEIYIRFCIELKFLKQMRRIEQL